MINVILYFSSFNYQFQQQQIEGPESPTGHRILLNPLKICKKQCYRCPTLRIILRQQGAGAIGKSKDKFLFGKCTLGYILQ